MLLKLLNILADTSSAPCRDVFHGRLLRPERFGIRDHERREHRFVCIADLRLWLLLRQRLLRPWLRRWLRRWLRHWLLCHGLRCRCVVTGCVVAGCCATGCCTTGCCIRFLCPGNFRRECLGNWFAVCAPLPRGTSRCGGCCKKSRFGFKELWTRPCTATPIIMASGPYAQNIRNTNLD